MLCYDAIVDESLQSSTLDSQENLASISHFKYGWLIYI